MVWIRTAAFSAAFVATMFVWLPSLILNATGRPSMVSGTLRGGAYALLGAGVAGMVWCWSSFSQHGRGTPAPFDPPRHLVVRGPYRYVRNPMYLGGILVLLGEAVLFASLPLLAYAVTFWLGTHLLVWGYEERRLTNTFGAAYRSYCAAVDRWIPHRVRPPMAQR
jgi:protein-S-isoprenylcysteine O-methyltransferase Ste14